MSDKINRMIKKIEEIKRLESLQPKILKNLFSKNEINDFWIYIKNCQLRSTIKHKMLLKKRWIKNFNKDLEDKFTRRASK